jgi:hypothetical protein
MSRTDRIQYLTRKAQRGVINRVERNELARLIGRDPRDFQSDSGLPDLVAIALVAIAIALLTEIFTKKV